MKDAINNCKCINELMLIGNILPYKKGYNLSLYANQDVEEGTLCLANDVVEDTYFNINKEVIKELYPIEYCPICGKKIEYRKEKVLRITK